MVDETGGSCGCGVGVWQLATGNWCCRCWRLALIRAVAGVEVKDRGSEDGERGRAGEARQAQTGHR